MMDIDIINAFTYGTTCESISHSLGFDALIMMWELLDIDAKYATGEDALMSNLSGIGKAPPYHSEDDSDDEANMTNL